MTDMVVLIAYDSSALLLKYLPTSYDFILTIDHRIGFRSGFSDSYSIILSPIHNLFSENLWLSLDI